MYAPSKLAPGLLLLVAQSVPVFLFNSFVSFALVVLLVEYRGIHILY